MNLPVHNRVKIKFKLYLIDNWAPSDKLIYYIGDDSKGIFFQNNAVSNI